MKDGFRSRLYSCMASRTIFRVTPDARRNEMLLEWTILYRELVSQQRKKRCDAFADPLDGAEWEGFGWLVKWIARSAARRSQAGDHRGKGTLDEPCRAQPSAAPLGLPAPSPLGSRCALE